MNEKVAAFLEQKRAEEESKRAEEKSRRDEALIAAGLFTEEEYDDKSGSTLYYDNPSKQYRKVPIELTDEEYDLIAEYPPKETPKANAKPISPPSVNDDESRFPKICMIIGIIIFIAGFIVGLVVNSDTGSFTTCLIVWFAAFFEGFTFLALGKIISLLDTLTRIPYRIDK